MYFYRRSSVVNLFIKLFQATKINELPSYDDRNYFFLADTSTCNNANIPRINQHGYVFKVLNSLQSSSPEIIGRAVDRTHKAS